MAGKRGKQENRKTSEKQKMDGKEDMVKCQNLLVPNMR
jgi:hypothetical protein